MTPVKTFFLLKTVKTEHKLSKYTLLTLKDLEQKL